MSGRATLASYTVNHHPWLPGVELPYVIGLVEMAEQAGLRLTTNIVNCPPDAVHGGMDVQVVFEHHRGPQRRRVVAAVRTDWRCRCQLMTTWQRSAVPSRAWASRTSDGGWDEIPSSSPWTAVWPPSTTPGSALADIDGLSTYPGAMGVPKGFTGAGAIEVMDASDSRWTGTTAGWRPRGSWARS